MTTSTKSMGDDVATYLAANGIGRKGSVIYVNNPPVNKNNFVLITDTGGAQPEQYYPLNHPSVQIAVYGEANKHAETWEKIMAIFILLNRKTNITIGSRDAMYSRAVASPQVVGLDPDKKRWVMTVNFLFKIREADGQ